MGKGTIISGGTDGQYQVQVNYDRVAYDAEIIRLTDQIPEYSIKISDKDSEITSLENEYSSMVIAGYTTESLQEKRNEITRTEKEKSVLIVYKLSFEKRKQYLEDNMPSDETRSAWCADLTEDLSGNVGTVEVPGEPTNLQIQPGYAGNAIYDQARDGQLLPTVVSTSAQAFYNLAMLPGWQKWKPLFRYATITAIDGDVASITLDNILSSQQALEINQTGTISGVSIEYMSCNGGAFEVGDEVLVKFTGQEWASPVIVGFKDNPKPCGCIIAVFCKNHVILFDPKTNDYPNGILKDDGSAITGPVIDYEISNFLETAEIASDNVFSNIYDETSFSADGYYDYTAVPIVMHSGCDKSQKITLTFLSSTTYDVTSSESTISISGTPNIYSDLVINDLFSLYATGWQGIWAAGDTFTFYISANEAKIFNRYNTYISTYWDGHPDKSLRVPITYSTDTPDHVGTTPNSSTYSEVETLTYGYIEGTYWEAVNTETSIQEDVESLITLQIYNSCDPELTKTITFNEWCTSAGIGYYDYVNYPIELSYGLREYGIGTTVTFVCSFTSSTDFQAFSSIVPYGATGSYMGSGNIGSDFIGLFQNYHHSPVFTLLAAGWIGTFAEGDYFIFSAIPEHYFSADRRVKAAGGTKIYAPKKFNIDAIGYGFSRNYLKEVDTYFLDDPFVPNTYDSDENVDYAIESPFSNGDDMSFSDRAEESSTTISPYILTIDAYNSAINRCHFDIKSIYYKDTIISTQQVEITKRQVSRLKTEPYPVDTPPITTIGDTEDVISKTTNIFFKTGIADVLNENPFDTPRHSVLEGIVNGLDDYITDIKIYNK